VEADVDHRGQQPQVVADGTVQGDHGEDAVLELLVGPVERPVGLHDPVGGRAVVVGEGLQGIAQHRGGLFAHGEHVVPQQVELVVEIVAHGATSGSAL
jgi:hypothetical protein